MIPTSGKPHATRRRANGTIFAIVLLAVGAGIGAQSFELRELLKDTDAGSHWIYGDIESGRALAKQTDKPLLLLFRCVP